MGKEVNAGTNTRSDLRLRVQTVFSQVLEGHKTFADIAPRYGLEVPEFEDLLRHKVDAKDFDRLKEASEKYEAARKKRRKQISVPLSSSLEEKITQMQPKENSTARISDTQKETLKIRAGILRNIEKELKQMYSLRNVTIPECEAKLKEEEDKVDKAKEELEVAKNVLKKALKQQEEAQKKLDKQNTQLLVCERNYNKLEEELAEIDNKVIYLVAPNYKGKMPEYGTFISVAPKDGVIVEDVSKVPLMHEPTMTDFFGVTDMKEAKEVYQYLQLVTKYFVESGEYNILVDDPATIKLLQKQELIKE